MSARVTADSAATELLARVLYAEAGQRPVRAVEALAALAINRARALHEAPSRARAIIAVLRAPAAFLVRHPRHPAHARFVAPTEGDPALTLCRRVARRAMRGALPDPTLGSRLWHDERSLPRWAIGRVPSASFGGLCFYAERD
jgi:spore germination cell wall hydrolase CwlJ-like protein